MAELGLLLELLFVCYHDVFDILQKRSEMAISIDLIHISTIFWTNKLITVIRVQ